MNINNKEFRLLNLVEYQNWNADKTPAYFMVRDIFWDEGKIALSNGNILLPHPSMDMIKPIEITEDWLLKFGFEKLTDKSKGFKSNSYTYTKGVSFIVHLNENSLSVNFWQGNEKKYVHQLQNLFYALTGVELSVS